MKKFQTLAALCALGVTAASIGFGTGPAQAAGQTHSYGSSINRTGFIGTVATGGHPKSGGTLVANTSIAELAGLDPITDTVDGTAGLSELYAIYDVLVRYDPVTNKYVPQLAQSFSANANHTVWTINLRPGVTFTDGTPLDAAAVAFNINRYSSDPATIYYYAGELSEIKSVTTPSDMTVQVTLNAPDPQFIWLFSQGLGLIGSPTAIQKEGEQQFDLNPVGAGPFMVKSYTPGKSLDLVRNPHYWGGTVYLNGINFEWPSGDNTKVQALKSGNLDIVHLSDPVDIANALQQGYGGFEWLRYGGGTVMMNERSGHHLDNVDVRKAIADAINPQIINSRVFQDKGIATSTLFPSGFLANNVRPIGYAAAQARKLLKSARSQTGWNGTLSILTSNDPTEQSEALTIEAMLNAVGFHTTITTAPSVSAFINDVYVNYNYDIAVAAIDVTDTDPWGQMVEEFVGPYGPDGYNNPAMTNALTQLQAAGTPAQLRAAGAKIQRLWNSTIPEVWFDVGQDTDVWSKHLHGVVPSSQSAVLLGKAWLSNG